MLSFYIAGTILFFYMHNVFNFLNYFIYLFLRERNDCFSHAYLHQMKQNHLCKGFCHIYDFLFLFTKISVAVIPILLWKFQRSSSQFGSVKLLSHLRYLKLVVLTVSSKTYQLFKFLLDVFRSEMNRYSCNLVVCTCIFWDKPIQNGWGYKFSWTLINCILSVLQGI